MSTITNFATSERAARFVLAATMEPDDTVTGRLLAAVGAVETVRLAVTEGPLPKSVDSVESSLWRSRVAPRMELASIEHARRETDTRRFGVLVPGDRDWPAGLNSLGHGAPVALWVSGAASLLAANRNDSVTITGARASTPYGETVTHELVSDLATSERVIVAGGAYGIDSAAHRAALTVGGQTIAVLPGGLSRPYPAGNRDLLGRIGDLGLLVSELPPDAIPTKWRSLARNRLLGALSGATVIVEGGYRSGSINVAARAAEIGRPVGAVPGPVTSAASAGTHRLLREGIASVITDSNDLNALMESSRSSNSPSLVSTARVNHAVHRNSPRL